MLALLSASLAETPPKCGAAHEAILRIGSCFADSAGGQWLLGDDAFGILAQWKEVVENGSAVTTTLSETILNETMLAEELHNLTGMEISALADKAFEILRSAQRSDADRLRLCRYVIGEEKKSFHGYKDYIYSEHIGTVRFSPNFAYIHLALK